MEMRPMPQDYQIHDVLLQEMHHRFFNSIQVIGSLAERLETGLTSPSGHQAEIDRLHDRIGSVARFNRTLSQAMTNGPNLEMLCMEVCADLIQVFECLGAEVTIRVEDLQMQPWRQRLLLLLLSELITNALKHAQYKQGLALRIEIERQTATWVMLRVVNNSVRDPLGPSSSPRIATALASSLGGSLQKSVGASYEVCVKFPIE
jgi:two-component sensor histidine kinase